MPTGWQAGQKQTRPVVAAISMVGPTARVAGDTEKSNVTMLQAGARKLTESLELGDYRLPPRRARR